jgi:hypothetical protein
MNRKRKNYQNYGSIAGFKITLHAHQQMKSRSISKKEVKKVIASGTIKKGNEPGTGHISSSNGILVIVNFTENLIITVVRLNLREKKAYPLRSKLKGLIISNPSRKKTKRPLKKQEKAYEISLEDYLGNKRKNPK